MNSNRLGIATAHLTELAPSGFGVSLELLRAHTPPLFFLTVAAFLGSCRLRNGGGLRLQASINET
jgi:hypothetical protein